MDKAAEMEEEADVLLDVTGLICPMPLLKAKRELNAMEIGEKLRILATDPTSQKDFKVFSEQSGHRLIYSSLDDGVYTHILQKLR